jgi:hypothetical protein
MQNIVFDTSVNISTVLALITALVGAGRFTQKILSALGRIEKIGEKLEHLAGRVDAIECDARGACENFKAPARADHAQHLAFSFHDV